MRPIQDEIAVYQIMMRESLKEELEIAAVCEGRYIDDIVDDALRAYLKGQQPDRNAG